MRAVWYTKSNSSVEPRKNSLIHLTEYGNYTFCDIKLSGNGRWFIEYKQSFLKTVNCEKCLKILENKQ